MQPSVLDVQAPFDPTGYAALSSAQLLQLVSGITPYADKGLIVPTADVGGVPQPPDADGTVKWKNYLWLRNTGGGQMFLYFWNPNIDSDNTYKRWQNVISSALSPNSVATAQVQDLAITSAKINDVDWGKLTNIPAVGGDLTGTLPNPSIANNSVTSAKLQSDAAIDANRAVGKDHVKNKSISPIRHLSPTSDGAALLDALSIVRVNAGQTALESIRRFITELANPTVAEAYKIQRVNAAGDGFEYVTSDDIRSKITTFTSAETALNTGGALLAVNHNLGAVPVSVRCVLVCKTAELAYGIGDEVDAIAFTQWASGSSIEHAYPSFIYGATATQVFASQNNLNTTISIPRKDTGAQANITNGNWKLKLYARL